jgi:cytochrome c-type biogenesis protein CcmH
LLKDPALESRARALSAELRCLVCQNQSIDDSDAPLAKDLRTLIREQLVKGESDAQIMDYVVARYGDYVLLKPRFNSRTLVLWGTPFAVLLIAGIAMFLRRRTVAAEPELPLTEDEQRTLQKALD